MTWKAAFLWFNSLLVLVELAEMLLEGGACSRCRIMCVPLGTWCSNVIKKWGLGLIWTWILSCVALDKLLTFLSLCFSLQNGLHW